MSVEYPLLGEPPVVEFANTRYEDDEGVVDFLADIDLVRGWLDAVDGEIVPRIEVLDVVAVQCLVRLREDIRAFFDGERGRSTLDSLAVAMNGSPPRHELVLDAEGHVLRRPVFEPTAAGAIALLAHAAIDLSGRVRVCARPACRMRYHQHHRRRRYCNQRCADADRQARFQRRHRHGDPT